jgi:hypothetical protein
MSFLKIIRDKYGDKKSSIKCPNQQGFSLSHWRLTFQTYNNRSNEDRKLYEAGLWFHKRFELIRNELKEIYYEDTKENLIRFQVGSLNWDIKKIIEENLFFDISDQTQSLSISRSVERASDYEHFIDSARFPLRDVLKQRRKNDSRSHTQKDLFTWLKKTREISILYHCLEDRFNSCLWNEWYIENIGTENEEFDLIRPIDHQKEIIFKINLSRWQSLNLELIDSWINYTSKPEKDFLLNLPRLSSHPEDEGQKMKLEIVSLTPSSSVLPPLEVFSITRVFKYSFFPEEFYKTPLPKMNNLNLIQMLEGWRFISSLTNHISVNHKDKEELLSIENLLKYSANFLKTDLANLICDATSISFEQALKFIDILTFKDDRDDIWLKPLIQINDKDLTIVFEALKADPVRLASNWLKEAKFEIGMKGKIFENYARDRLNQKKNLSNAEVYLHEFKYDHGDIDLILRVGNKIIICELKCSLYPVNSIDEHNYFQDLHEGAIQVRRNVNFVKANTNDFLRKINLEIMIDDSLLVYPAIISNLPLATGMKINDIPIVDLRIVEQYLCEGKFIKYSQMTETGFKPLNEQVQFYSSEQEAEERLIDYLENPPQIKEFMEDIIWARTPVNNLGADLKPAYAARCVLQMP